MNLVYLIQSGPGGPVRLGTSTERGWSRALSALQRGNPTILTVVHLLDGDERLERELHVRWSALRLRDDWYQPTVLDDLPESAKVLPRDETDEDRRQALADLADLAPRT